MKNAMRVQLWAVLVTIMGMAGGCLPSSQCEKPEDCPLGQKCASDGWCEYANGLRVLGRSGGSSGSSSSSSSSGGSAGCADVAAPVFKANCVANLDVLDMDVPCVRFNFSRGDLPSLGSPTCPGLTGGKVGGFEVHAASAMTVTALLSPNNGAVRSEQDPAGCNSGPCGGLSTTFNTAEHTRIWVEIGALGDNFSLVLDGRP